MNELELRLLGSIPYSEALALQKELHTKISEGEQKSTLLLLEHLPVITLGKHASEEDLLLPPASLDEMGISLERVDRGGEATAHEPGQLVIYPLMDLRRLKMGAKVFVNTLEDCVIELLSSYGISSRRDEEFPGVWVGMQKVCSVGVRISRGVSYHGLALNVLNDLKTFESIIPCGIRDRSMVTVSQVLGRELSVSEVSDHFVKIFSKKFKVSSVFFGE